MGTLKIKDIKEDKDYYYFKFNTKELCKEVMKHIDFRGAMEKGKPCFILELKEKPIVKIKYVEN